jgi:predicted DNA-binding transcriptional regulator AlpA
MPNEDIIRGLEADELIRKSKGSKYFGLKHSALEDAIDRGEIPRPFTLTATGRAKAWTGRQIIEHHRQRIAATRSTASVVEGKKAPRLACDGRG